MSTMSRYEVEVSAEPLSQFRLQDLSSKQELSTILRDSPNTTFSSQIPLKAKGKKKQKEGKKEKKS